MDSIIGFLQTGLLDWSWWAILAAFLIATQITVLSVTLYLHRCMAHRGVDLHPIVTHPMRLWLWLSTGMVTREWVAVHRKHHARCETAEDPHSPQTHGLNKVLFDGVALYKVEAEDDQTLEKYGIGCPNDWPERLFYSKSVLGPTILLFVNFALFGVIGVSIWALQMIWIPFFAAGVINGLGHYVGYRNFITDDTSTNLTPWGLALGGEELHNNHHAFPSSAKFALKKWEVDMGWVVIRALSAMNLAKVRRVAPELSREDGKALDADALKAVFVHRFSVMSDYCRNVIKPIADQEARIHTAGAARRLRRHARRLMSADVQFLNEAKQQRLSEVLADSQTLATVYEYRLKLQALWDRSTSDPELLLEGLKQWCREAEQTGIRALEDFAGSLKGYRLANA